MVTNALRVREVYSELDLYRVLRDQGRGAYNAFALSSRWRWKKSAELPHIRLYIPEDEEWLRERLARIFPWARCSLPSSLEGIGYLYIPYVVKIAAVGFILEPYFDEIELFFIPRQ